MSDQKERLERPDIYVLGRFLDQLWERGQPVKKTRLQMAVGLNYITFRQYLDWLVRKELVAVRTDEDGHEFIALTSKGVDAYHKMVGWVNEVIGVGIRDR